MAEQEARMGAVSAAPATQYGAPVVEEHKMQPIANPQQPIDPRYQQQAYQQQAYQQQMA